MALPTDARNGQHQWAVIVTYGMTAEEAAGELVRLDAAHRRSLDGPACLNCERIWSPSRAKMRCPAQWYEIKPMALGRVIQE